MTKIYKGFAYRLGAVVEIEGYRAYLLAGRSSDYEEPFRIDLGRRRVLNLCSEEAYLILESREELIIRKLDQKEIKLTGYLRDDGLKCRIVANYTGGQYTSYCPMWKYALNGGNAIFSENGYAIQSRIWADCWEHSFDMVIFKPDWLKVGGEEICVISANMVLDDLVCEIEDFITRVLSEQTDITEEEFYMELTSAGVGCISQISVH